MTTAELTGLELMKQTAAGTDAPPFIGRLLGLGIDEVEYGKVTTSLHTRPLRIAPCRQTISSTACSTAAIA
ncbi:MAG: hypothetical protein JWR32_2558 [Mycobacterium sp.]|jgi:hypothetical protein|nr:hypothetical protein [Mycobacterium sp.]